VADRSVERDRQPTMQITTTDLPTAAGHTLLSATESLLREDKFDDFAEVRNLPFHRCCSQAAADDVRLIEPCPARRAALRVLIASLP
jgi:hypothetical protein